MPAPAWITTEQEEAIRAEWHNTSMTLKNIGDMVGLSTHAVSRRAMLLGLDDRRAVKKKGYRPPPQASQPVTRYVPAPKVWNDNWSIKSPTSLQLRAGSARVRSWVR